MTGFICHDDYLSKTAILSDEQLGRLFRACMKYHATGEIVHLEGIEGMAFEFIFMFASGRLKKRIRRSARRIVRIGYRK